MEEKVTSQIEIKSILEQDLRTNNSEIEKHLVLGSESSFIQHLTDKSDSINKKIKKIDSTVRKTMKSSRSKGKYTFGKRDKPKYKPSGDKSEDDKSEDDKPASFTRVLQPKKKSKKSPTKPKKVKSPTKPKKVKSPTKPKKVKSPTKPKKVKSPKLPDDPDKDPDDPDDPDYPVEPMKHLFGKVWSNPEHRLKKSLRINKEIQKQLLCGGLTLHGDAENFNVPNLKVLEGDYTYHFSAPDGNCLFISLVESYKKNMRKIKKYDKHFPKDHVVMRRQLVSDIMDDWENYEGFVAQEDADENLETKENYAERMGTDGVYGDNPEITAFCSRYNCRVGILSYNEDSDSVVLKNIIEKQTEATDSTPNYRMIYIFHHATDLAGDSGQHYASVVPFHKVSGDVDMVRLRRDICDKDASRLTFKKGGRRKTKRKIKRVRRRTKRKTKRVRRRTKGTRKTKRRIRMKKGGSAPVAVYAHAALPEAQMPPVQVHVISTDGDIQDFLNLSIDMWNMNPPPIIREDVLEVPDGRIEDIRDRLLNPFPDPPVLRTILDIHNVSTGKYWNAVEDPRFGVRCAWRARWGPQPGFPQGVPIMDSMPGMDYNEVMQSLSRFASRRGTVSKPYPPIRMKRIRMMYTEHFVDDQTAACIPDPNVRYSWDYEEIPINLTDPEAKEWLQRKYDERWIIIGFENIE